MIRKAVIQDVRNIHQLLAFYAEQGLLLSRPLSEIYDHLRDFVVAEDEGSGKNLLGVCALGICWERLAEIRSLAVAEDQKGKGLGVRLVKICLKEAESLGVKEAFVLTYVPGFFSKLGFEEVKKSTLPHKVWADCLKCAKFPDCDEIAMTIKL